MGIGVPESWHLEGPHAEAGFRTPTGWVPTCVNLRRSPSASSPPSLATDRVYPDTSFPLCPFSSPPQWLCGRMFCGHF